MAPTSGRKGPLSLNFRIIKHALLYCCCVDRADISWLFKEDESEEESSSSSSPPAIARRSKFDDEEDDSDVEAKHTHRCKIHQAHSLIGP